MKHLVSTFADVLVVIGGTFSDASASVLDKTLALVALLIFAGFVTALGVLAYDLLCIPFDAALTRFWMYTHKPEVTVTYRFLARRQAEHGHPGRVCTHSCTRFYTHR